MKRNDLCLLNISAASPIKTLGGDIFEYNHPLRFLGMTNGTMARLSRVSDNAKITVELSLVRHCPEFWKPKTKTTQKTAVLIFQDHKADFPIAELNLAIAHFASPRVWEVQTDCDYHAYVVAQGFGKRAFNQGKAQRFFNQARQMREAQPA